MQTSPLPFRLSVLSFALLAVFSQASYAQQATDTLNKNTTPVKPSEEKVQKVEVSGAKGYNERRLDTASKIVVTQEDIVRYGDTAVSDVLKRLPGVTIGGVQGRGGEIRMRGLGSGYTQIMLNGEPSPPGFSLDSISPDIIERIEVIRSGTAELSTQAIAGAINIVLKKAVQTSQREVKFGMQDDNSKFGGNVSFQLSDKVDRMSYSIAVNAADGMYSRPSFVDESSFDTSAKPILVRHTDSESVGHYKSLGMAPRVNWNLVNGDTITTQTFINVNQFGGNNFDTSNTTLDKRNENGDTKNEYVDTKTKIDSRSAMLRSNLNWIHKLADSAKLDLKAGFNFNQRSSEVAFLGLDQAKKEIMARSVDSDASDKGLTFSGKYTAPFVEDHAFVMGWDGAYSQRHENRDELVINIGVKQTPIDEVFNAKVARIALFAQDEWNVTKNWSIYAGLRWEALDTHSQGSTYTDVANRSSVWSPILQTLWKLPEYKNDQIRLALTRTYKAPDTSRLIPRRFRSNSNNRVSPDSMGNPNLKPELAWGIDAAFEHYLGDGGLLSASVFVRRIEDITLTDLYQETTGEKRWVETPVNKGTATTRGIELEAKVPLRSLMSDAPAIDFRANLSFNWSTLSEVPGPNNRIDSQTPISANLGMDYKPDHLPLTVGGNMSFQNGGPVQISESQRNYSTPKRVIDVYALWKFTPKTNLRVSVGNTLHQDNIASSSIVTNRGLENKLTTTPTNAVTRIMLEHKF